MNLSKGIKILTILVISRGVLPVFTASMTTTTLINLITAIISFVVIFIARKRFRTIFIQKLQLVNTFFLYGVAILLYSCFVARSYEQWRYVATVFLPTLILPFFIIAGGDKDYVKSVIKTLIYIALPLSTLLYFSELGGMWDFSHYVSFLYLMVLASPYVSLSWKCLFLLLSVISILSNIDNRSNILNFSVVAIILVIGYLPSRGLVRQSMNILRSLFLVVPVILLVLGILDIFNVFRYGDSVSEEFKINYSTTETSLTKDTRTGIFKDALVAIDKQNAYLYGISAAGLYKTELAEVNDEYFEVLRLGRMGNEVGILEYLLRGGIIYVILTFLLYYHASKLAIKRSNNLFCMSLGLFIAFRWFFLFIESQPVLNLANLTDFLVIGICLCPAFRKLRDRDMKIFLRQALKIKEPLGGSFSKRRTTFPEYTIDYDKPGFK